MTVRTSSGRSPASAHATVRAPVVPDDVRAGAAGLGQRRVDDRGGVGDQLGEPVGGAAGGGAPPGE